MAGKIEVHPATWPTEQDALDYGARVASYGYETVGTVESTSRPGRFHVKLRSTRTPTKETA